MIVLAFIQLSAFNIFAPNSAEEKRNRDYEAREQRIRERGVIISAKEQSSITLAASGPRLHGKTVTTNMSKSKKKKKKSVLNIWKSGELSKEKTPGRLHSTKIAYKHRKSIFIKPTLCIQSYSTVYLH